MLILPTPLLFHLSSRYLPQLSPTKSPLNELFERIDNLLHRFRIDCQIIILACLFCFLQKYIIWYVAQMRWGSVDSPESKGVSIKCNKYFNSGNYITTGNISLQIIQQKTCNCHWDMWKYTLIFRRKKPTCYIIKKETIALSEYLTKTFPFE